MWLLENSGALLGGRKCWLRPDRQYLFGRTGTKAASGEQDGKLVIKHQSVSRQHLRVEIRPITQEDVQNPSGRSTLVVEDLNTKMGTIVNGMQIQGKRIEITQPFAEIRLGHLPDTFRISWFPVALGISHSAREFPDDQVAKLRDVLRPLDIRYSPIYVPEVTHLVSRKRNTARGLQALIDAKYIVSQNFIDAIRRAGTDDGATEGVSGPFGTSPLERDFAASWPSELEFLPPKGEEPVERAIGLFAPDATRANIFEGFSFVFYDHKQHSELLAAVVAGKGKALYRAVTPGETTVDDFVRYVKGLAGEEGTGTLENGRAGSGVVVVRHPTSRRGATQENGDWLVRFATAVARRLNHRPIEQKEFLDAILMKDPSSLRRPLEEDVTSTHPGAVLSSGHFRVPDHSLLIIDQDSPEMSGALGVSQVAASDRGVSRGGNSRTQSHNQHTVEATSAAPGRRRAGIGAFKGFAYDSDSADEPTVLQPEVGDDDNGLFISQSDSGQRDPTDGGARKRPASSLLDIDSLSVMDGIAPTAAAVKRQRIDRGEDPVPQSTVEVATATAGGSASARTEFTETKRAKARREIDIVGEARKNREAAEARARAEREDLEHLPEGVDLDEIRRLAVTETIEVRPGRALSRNGREPSQGRWDPRWNGRKNFKGFLARGVPQGRQARRIIVELEEAKSKDFGVGDEYWLETASPPRARAPQPRGSRGGMQQATQGAAPIPQVATRGASDSDDSSLGDELPEIPTNQGRTDSLTQSAAQSTRARSQRTASQRAASQRSPSRGAKVVAERTREPSQRIVASRPEAQSGTKRSTAVKEATVPKPKRVRTATVADSEDSDDELKFRFGRR